MQEIDGEADISGIMLLDALKAAKEKEPSLTLDTLVVPACGSDGMNINGKRLACVTQLKDLPERIVLGHCQVCQL